MAKNKNLKLDKKMICNSKNAIIKRKKITKVKSIMWKDEGSKKELGKKI